MSMNVSQENETRNPWQDRSSVPHAKRTAVFLAALAFFFCALALPFSTSENISLAVIAVLFAYIVYVARMPVPVTLLLLTAFACVLLTGTFAAGAIFLCVTVGVCSGAFLLTALRHSYFVVLLPVASAVIAYVILQSVEVAFFALVFLPAAILLAIATRTGQRRTTAVCYALGGLLLAVVAGLAFFVWKQSSAAGLSFYDYIESLRSQLVHLLISVREEMLVLMQENLVQEGGTLTEEASAQLQTIRDTLSDALFTDLVALLFNLLPAIIVSACSIVAYEAQALLNANYRTAGLGCVVTEAARTFTMSVASAILFMIAFVVTLFAASDSIPVMVANNLCLMLLPGFCVVAVQSMVAFFASTRGGGRILILLLIASMCCCTPGAIFYVLAFWGAYQCVMDAIRKKVTKYISPDEEPPHSEDGED